jgi:ribonuclease-3
MTRKQNDLSVLEERLGYRFRKIALLEEALTHNSAVVGRSRKSDYQRLEFLGDRVLALAIAEMLFQTFPNDSEGDLARKHAALVRNEAWVEIAILLGVGNHLFLGLSEENSEGRHKQTILGDACEAIFGAIYLDSDYATVFAVIDRMWRPMMMKAPAKGARDAKTILQEWAQARGMPAPVYREVDRSGPAHKPQFRIVLELPGMIPVEGVGPSKRDAERAAASVMLAREGLEAGND